MNMKVSRMAVLVAACLWLGAGGGEGAPAPISGLLPASGEVKGWVSEETPQVFEGDGLFKYMDGGAEIYKEYGFGRLAVREYRNAAGRSIVVEVFEMSGDAGAFGIFTFKSAAEGKSVDMGFEGQLAEYYLNFWSGKYLVTVTGQEEDAETLAGVESLGRAVASRVGRAGNRPAVAGLLPQKRMTPWSLRYILGPVGLRNFPDISAEDLTGWRECISAKYGEGERLFLFRYDQNEGAAKALSRFESVLEESGRYKGFRAGEAGRASALDPRGNTLRASAAGKALVISIGGGDWSLVEEALRKVG